MLTMLGASFCNCVANLANACKCVEMHAGNRNPAKTCSLELLLRSNNNISHKQLVDICNVCTPKKKLARSLAVILETKKQTTCKKG